jgi:hypothetical protein
MNHLDAFLYKKVRTAAVVMTLVILTVVLGACQKSEPEAEKAAAPGSTVLDKVSEASGEATKATGDMAEETIEKTGEAAEAAGEMVEKGIEKAGEAAGAAGEMKRPKTKPLRHTRRGAQRSKKQPARVKMRSKPLRMPLAVPSEGASLPKTE